MHPPTADFNVLIEIADLSPSAVFIYSIAHREIIYANSSCVRMLGLDKGTPDQDILGLLPAIVHSDREYAIQMFLNLMERSFVAEAELRLMPSGDSHLVISCTASLVNNRSAIVLYAQDITRPRQHENYLMEFGARKNAVLDTITHHISGALNLMNNLSAEAARLISDSEQNKISTYLSLLNRNNARCLQIIDDLMNNEHTRSPAVFVKKSRTDLISHVAFVQEEFAHSYPQRQFAFHHPKTPVYVTTDEIKVLQVVNNLLSNAVKFSLNEAPVEISISDHPSEVVVSVHDYGIGIPESLAPFIFQRQSGAGRTGLNGEKSYEIGLSICSNLVNLIGGRIWFESEVDKGSTFYFTIPK